MSSLQADDGAGVASAADEAVLAAKAAHLHARLEEFESLLIAYSGGVDSAFLALAASRVLPGRLLCVTADSPSYPRRHRELAERVARDFQLPHEFIETSEMERPEYRANPANRCYYCKTELYEHLSELATARGFAAIADGSNADDRGDYRPGRQAAREFGVKSPLDDAGLTKAEIRELSRRAGLPTWDEPASACLSSRIPYQSEVTVSKLSMIEQAEEALRRHGFRVCRVRHHETVARLEIGRDEMARALDPAVAQALVSELKAIGYQYVCLDLQGYRTGSLNEILKLRPV
jgi:pyridinium-3,5-biscarboxylic acid mononucleotide sulfurtransferase